MPILTIRLELIENNVAFRPPLDQSTSYSSVQETVAKWLQTFLARGKLVNMLGGKVGVFSFSILYSAHKIIACISAIIFLKLYFLKKLKD